MKRFETSSVNCKESGVCTSQISSCVLMGMNCHLVVPKGNAFLKAGEGQHVFIHKKRNASWVVNVHNNWPLCPFRKPRGECAHFPVTLHNLQQALGDVHSSMEFCTFSGPYAEFPTTDEARCLPVLFWGSQVLSCWLGSLQNSTHLACHKNAFRDLVSVVKL